MGQAGVDLMVKKASKSQFLFIFILAFSVPGCFTASGLDEGPDDGSRLEGKTDCFEPEEADRLSDHVLQLLNLERADANLPPVGRNSVLDVVADEYACRMVNEKFFSHTDPLTGHGPGDRAVLAGYTFFAVGENLAAGQESPADVMKVWMESPTHREIILDPGWTEVGLSVRAGGEYGIYWVQEFGVPAE